MVKKGVVLFATLAFLLPLFLYGATLCPTVPVGDGGELICAAHRMGIAHPTGYPLFCLMGRIFSMALPLSNVAARLNFMSALFASLAALLVFFLARELFGGLLENSPFHGQLLSLATALVFAFSETMWAQAVQSEVYALHVFLVAALLLVMLLWRRFADGRLASLGAFLWGLSFANHTSVIFLSGVVLYMTISGWRRLSLRRYFPGMILFFLLGVSLYLYLPLRSALDPLHDWGNPETLGRLWDHVTGRQYRQFFVLGWPIDVWNNLVGYVKMLAGQWGLPGLILSLVGALVHSRQRRGAFTLFALAILGNVLLVSAYQIPDIEPYYLPSYLVFGLWLGFALAAGVKWLRPRWGGRGSLLAAGAIALALVMLPLVRNCSRVSQRGRFVARDYGMNILSSVEPHAILFTAADNEAFPTMYLHDVEGIRPDVLVFDLGSTVERMSRFLGPQRAQGVSDPAQLRRMVVEHAHRPIYFAKEHMSMGTDPLQIRDLALEPFGLVYRLQKNGEDAWEAPLPWFQYRGGAFLESMPQGDYKTRMLVANYHLSHGEDLWARADSTAAREAFSQARGVLQEVDKTQIHNSMGVFFRRIGWLEGARLEFNRALRCSQQTRAQRSDVHANLGNLYADLGQVDMARREMYRALHVWPRNTMAQFNLARLQADEHMKYGQFAQAAVAFEKMLAVDPKNPVLWYNLGLLYAHRLQRPQRAAECFRRSLTLTPEGSLSRSVTQELERLQAQRGRR